MTLNIGTFSTTTLSIITFSIIMNENVTLNVMADNCIYAECHIYAGCHYDECRGAQIDNLYNVTEGIETPMQEDKYHKLPQMSICQCWRTYLSHAWSFPIGLDTMSSEN
jgi:hypothetical protein